MKLCIISDTHGEHMGLQIPECDALIHCGDITSFGKEHSVIEFLDWFKNLDQCKNKIFIAGNHDFLFERNEKIAKQLVPENIIYLEDSMIEINGVKFWGTPVTLPFHNWAFNRTPEQIIKYWKMIPDGIDVLITHGAPKYIMDTSPWSKTHTGSDTLAEEVMNRIKPKIHCFGHIHDCYGIKKINDITFINASNLSEEYEITNKPIIIDI
jgi:Icc-related predicted phosphoesterase